MIMAMGFDVACPHLRSCGAGIKRWRQAPGEGDTEARTGDRRHP